MDAESARRPEKRREGRFNSRIESVVQITLTLAPLRLFERHVLRIHE